MSASKLPRINTIGRWQYTTPESPINKQISDNFHMLTDSITRFVDQYAPKFVEVNQIPPNMRLFETSFGNFLSFLSSSSLQQSTTFIQQIHQTTSASSLPTMKVYSDQLQNFRNLVHNITSKCIGDCTSVLTSKYMQLQPIFDSLPKENRSFEYFSSQYIAQNKSIQKALSFLPIPKEVSMETIASFSSFINMASESVKTELPKHGVDGNEAASISKKLTDCGSSVAECLKETISISNHAKDIWDLFVLHDSLVKAAVNHASSPLSSFPQKEDIFSLTQQGLKSVKQLASNEQNLEQFLAKVNAKASEALQTISQLRKKVESLETELKNRQQQSTDSSIEELSKLVLGTSDAKESTSVENEISLITSNVRAALNCISLNDGLKQNKNGTLKDKVEAIVNENKANSECYRLMLEALQAQPIMGQTLSECAFKSLKSRIKTYEWQISQLRKHEESKYEGFLDTLLRKIPKTNFTSDSKKTVILTRLNSLLTAYDEAKANASASEGSGNAILERIKSFIPEISKVFEVEVTNDNLVDVFFAVFEKLLFPDSASSSMKDICIEGGDLK